MSLHEIFCRLNIVNKYLRQFENNICLDVNVDTCSKSENQIDLQQSSINEVVDLKYKALISSFVNSGLGLGGMFYVLMYYLIEDWKYVFIVGVCLSAVSGIIIKIFYSDSLVQCLVNKDYEKFYKNLLYIARMNGREKEFKEGIINDEKYKSCLEKLKEYTNEDTEQKATGQQTGSSFALYMPL